MNWLKSRGYENLREVGKAVGKHWTHVARVLNGERKSRKLMAALRSLPLKQKEGKLIKTIEDFDDMWLDHLKKGGKA